MEREKSRQLTRGQLIPTFNTCMKMNVLNSIKSQQIFRDSLMERKKIIQSLKSNKGWSQDNKKYYYAKYTISRAITVLKDRGKTVVWNELRKRRKNIIAVVP